MLNALSSSPRSLKYNFPSVRTPSTSRNKYFIFLAAFTTLSGTNFIFLNQFSKYHEDEPHQRFGHYQRRQVMLFLIDALF